MRAAAALLVATICLAGEDPGLRPRPSQEDYAVQAGDNRLTVAAALLSNEEVKNAFATALVPNYIVLEVAVYPGNAAVDLQHDDFVLRVGDSRALVRPVDARTIAARLHRKATADQRAGSSPSDIVLYPSIGVGVGSGPSFPDGRRTGVGTGVGVGVGVGNPGPTNPPPASTDADRDTMELELSEKSLPERKVTAPVAGYLYFPVTSPGKRKPSERLELQYFGGRSKLSMRIPAVRDK